MWNKCVEFAIQFLVMLFDDNRFYISGINAKKVPFEFPENLTFISSVVAFFAALEFGK